MSNEPLPALSDAITIALAMPVPSRSPTGAADAGAAEAGAAADVVWVAEVVAAGVAVLPEDAVVAGAADPPQPVIVSAATAASDTRIGFTAHTPGPEQITLI
ncbi:MAG: hypothetical protein IPL45_02350 [Actinomycetales bacterium]|nr:hypothetical protein [Actinomycetales bacterium]